MVLFFAFIVDRYTFVVYFLNMKHHVVIPKKISRKLKTKIPAKVRDLFVLLIDDIGEKGPEQPDWMNYSKLGDYTYHCHLNYSWVAVWRCEEEKIILAVCRPDVSQNLNNNVA